MGDQWLVPLPNRSADSTGIRCLYCDSVFQTEAAERRHISEEHPDESSLQCPACKVGGFKTPSELMGHIERGVCERLSLKDLNRRRVRKLAFRQQLGLQGPVRHNFSRFIDKRAPDTTQSPLLLAAGADVSGPSRESSVSLMSAPTKDSSRAPSVLTVRSDGTINSNTALILGREQQVSDRHELFDDYMMGDDDLLEVWDDPEKCWNKFSEKYHCPRARCPKTFKASAGLLAHLRSPAHSNVRYTCPECHKELHCLQGMTAHAEDPASRCGISKTDKFAIYMEQLTGGLIDVIFVDGGSRVKYETSQVAEAEFEDALAARSDGYDDFHRQKW